MSEEKSCFGCKDRYVGCHSACEHYKRRREKADEILRKRDIELKARDDLDGFVCDGVARARKKRGSRR